MRGELVRPEGPKVNSRGREAVVEFERDSRREAPAI